MDLIQVLSYVKERPIMYLKAKTLNQLTAFITGWRTALSTHQIEYPAEEKFYNEFYYYLRLNYKLKREHSWEEMIEKMAKNKKKDAFDLFFELLEEFKRQDKCISPD